MAECQHRSLACKKKKKKKRTTGKKKNQKFFFNFYNRKTPIAKQKRATGKKKSQHFFFSCSNVYNRLANHLRSLFVARLTSQTVRPSEMWQTPEKKKKKKKNPSLCVSVSLTLLSQSFPLSGWAAAGFQTNSPKHVVCESVRPALLLGTKAAIHNVSRWRWHPRENGQSAWASRRRRQSKIPS